MESSVISINSGWVLWVMDGVGLDQGRNYVSYKAQEGFDTKEACYAAAEKYLTESKSMFRSDPRAIQCWPVGHDPNNGMH